MFLRVAQSRELFFSLNILQVAFALVELPKPEWTVVYVNKVMTGGFHLFYRSKKDCNKAV